MAKWNRTEGGGIIYTSKTSWLNGTGQKSDGIICTSKTSWLNGTGQKSDGTICTSKTSWLNGTGQKSDGIICTRKTPSALSRWALSYNMQSRIASQTREVFCADPDDGIDHNEHNRGRRGQVKTDEDNLLTPLKNLICSTEMYHRSCETLHLEKSSAQHLYAVVGDWLFWKTL